MKELRAGLNKFALWAFNAFFYDWASVLGCVLLLIAVILTARPAKGMGGAARLALDIAAYAAAIFLLCMSGAKRRRRKMLRQSGTRMQGRVTGVRRSIIKLHMNTMHYADEDAVHPYSIEYSYTFNGRQYSGGTEYFWSCPALRVGDALDVFVDERRPKSSACDDTGIKLI